MRPWLFIFTALLVASLTFLGQASGTSNQWSGTTDAFSRVGTENNNTILSSTFGHVNGQATLTATLDNQPMAITAEGTNAMIWNAQMELTPGQHQLIIAAAHPSGQFTAYATNTFTNSIAYQTTVDTYDGAGNVTNRVWLNPNGTTNRIQTFSWDGRGRLHAVTQRDANNSGYNWSAIYDALDRRLSTTSYDVTNGVVLNTLPNTINSYYDPEVEFLELGVAYGTKMAWKMYGPDADGVYGGENGTGGNELDTPTMARGMPKKLNAGKASRLRTQSMKAKLTYFSLNKQTPCPPRSAVPANQDRISGAVSLQSGLFVLGNACDFSDYVGPKHNLIRSCRN